MILHCIVFLEDNTALYCISGGLYCIVLYIWRIILHFIVFLEDYTALYCISGGFYCILMYLWTVLYCFIERVLYSWRIIPEGIHFSVLYS